MNKFHTFIFEVLKLDKSKFMEFFKNKVIISLVRSENIYKFVEKHKNMDLFLQTKIPYVTLETKQKVLNYLYEEPHMGPEKITSILEVINGAFAEKDTLSLREIYQFVEKTFGVGVNMKTNGPYLLKNGTKFDEKRAIKNQQGAIRSFLEEHSADSRQHWVKENKIY